MFKRGHAERGQALIIVVFVFVGLLVVVGLAIDGGVLFLERRRMQNAADAGALGGAQVLAAAMCGTLDPVGDDQAVAVAVNSYAEDNGVEDSDGAPGNMVNDNVTAAYVKVENGTVTEFNPPVLVGNSAYGGSGVPTGAVGVVVTTTIQYRTFLVSLVGVETAGAGGRATAVVGTRVTGGGGLPIIMDVDVVGQLGVGQEFDVEFCSPGAWCQIVGAHGEHLAAHRGWLNLEYIYNAADAPTFPRARNRNAGDIDLRRWISGGSGSDVVIYAGSMGGDDGDFIHAIPGEQTKAIQTICDYFGPGDLIYIPLFDRVESRDYMEANFEEPPVGWPSQGGSEFYHVVGFVGFKLAGDDPCRTRGSVKSLHGEFVEALIGQGIASPTVCYGCEDVCATTGMLAVSLWE